MLRQNRSEPDLRGNGLSADGLVMLMRHADAATIAVSSLAERHEFAANLDR